MQETIYSNRNEFRLSFISLLKTLRRKCNGSPLLAAENQDVLSIEIAKMSSKELLNHKNIFTALNSCQSAAKRGKAIVITASINNQLAGYLILLPVQSGWFSRACPSLEIVVCNILATTEYHSVESVLRSEAAAFMKDEQRKTVRLFGFHQKNCCSNKELSCLSNSLCGLGGFNR